MNGPPSMQRQAVGRPSGFLGLALAWVGQIFFVVFLTAQKNSCSLLNHTLLKKKKEMCRAGESSVSFKTSVLGRRIKGERPKVFKQRAGGLNVVFFLRKVILIALNLTRSVED